MRTPARRICLITVFRGAWPNWMPFFLRSCEANSEIAWLFFGDAPPPHDAPANCHFTILSTAELEKRVSETIRHPFQLCGGYKLVDLKPTYGHLFAQEIQEYEFWGYTDLDVIYGQPLQLISQQVLDEFEIITPSSRLLVGHFTLLRNTQKMKLLYQSCPEWLETLCSKSAAGFDEQGFNRVVWALAAAGKIKLYARDLKEEDILLRLNGRKRYLIIFWGGRLLDPVAMRWLTHFHFMESKWSPGFSIDRRKVSTRFFVTPRKICCLTDPVDWVRLLICACVAFVWAQPWYLRNLIKRAAPRKLRLAFFKRNTARG